MNKEELQKKHLEAITTDTAFRFDSYYSADELKIARDSLASACTAITLQTVVDVLEGLKEELFFKGRSCAEINAKIEEYTPITNK